MSLQAVMQNGMKVFKPTSVICAHHTTIASQLIELLVNIVRIFYSKYVIGSDHINALARHARYLRKLQFMTTNNHVNALDHYSTTSD